MTQKELDILTNIIGAVESGGQRYGNRRYDCYCPAYNNTPSEVTCTLGWAGNYGSNAKKLVKMIFDADPVAFRKADTANIEKKLSVDWVATKWNPNSSEKKALISIITTDIGKKCQDQMFQESAKSYIKNAEAYDVTNVPAQMMWCEIQHLGGLTPVKRIFGRAAKPYTPDTIFASLLLDQKDTSNNNQVGDKIFQSRHECCLRWIKQYVGSDKQMGTVNGLIARAKAEIGYIEKASNADLDSKTGNKGTSNYTKYSRDINNLGLAGCQGQPWCITFQFWLEVQEFGLDKALEHWHMTKSNYVGYNCFSTYNKFPANKRSTKPQLGAVVIFTQSHAGRVISINGNTFTTIEGNTSSAAYDRNGGMVAQKTYNITDPKIKGFLHIDYNTSTSSTQSSACTLKNGSTGTAVKTLQEQLQLTGFCGCDYYANNNFTDGIFGSNTEKYVKLMQKSADIEVDGIYGANSQAALSKYVASAKLTSVNFTVDTFLANALKIANANKSSKFSYGNAACLPSVNADDKLTSCDRYVDQVLWASGLKDVGNRAVNQLPAYLASKGATKITNASQVKAGDIIFFNGHTFILGRKVKDGIWERYDSGNKDRIQLTGAYASYSSQPFHEGLEGFLYAYRLPFKVSTSTNTSKFTPTNNISKGQKWLNTNYSSIIKSATGKLLDIDGSYGTHSRWAALAVWKDVVNRKYGYKLTSSNKNFGASCKAAASKATVKNGSSGTFVYIVQFILSAKGFYKGKMDAEFGSETKAAVIAFQKSKKLSQDGICGANTWYALFNN